MEPKNIDGLRAIAAQVPGIAELFSVEPSRAVQFTHSVHGLHVDFSRQRINADLMEALVAYVNDIGVMDKVAAMFEGRHINSTEDRAVMHVALRSRDESGPEARAAEIQLRRAMTLADDIRKSGKFDAVVNIGIGGSHLGPAMVTRALRSCHDGPTPRFVSNIDPADLDAALEGLNPSRTFFVVSSKTFSTLETMHNARRAQQWVRSAVGDSWSRQFCAATANASAALAWGIDAERCLEFYEWVGGRFSVSSVIGLPVMCSIGSDRFAQFLDGMRLMDQHFASAQPSGNLPVIHALSWFANLVCHGFPTVAVVPYSNDLGELPAFLQQLVMESNGKSVDVNGDAVIMQTSPVVWGEPGTNGQHAFFQFLHQGTQVVPVEFVSSARPMGNDPTAHDLLVANMIAQSEALAAGSPSSEPHRQFEGNRPSTVVMLEELSPANLGALIAMYEHSTAVQGWLVGVNSFDQFGVELGKAMALDSAKSIASGNVNGAQTMTHPLLEWYLRHR